MQSETETPIKATWPRVPTTKQEEGCLTGLVLGQGAEGQREDHQHDKDHLGLHGGCDLLLSAPKENTSQG